jgi:ribosomal protein RSM22 (predicted rRNA methylase)
MTNISSELLKNINNISYKRFLNENLKYKYDIVIASYVLNEISNEIERNRILKILWKLTKGVLVFIEPGTPLGYKIIKDSRDFLLSEFDDTNVLAPVNYFY